MLRRPPAGAPTDRVFYVKLLISPWKIPGASQ